MDFANAHSLYQALCRDRLCFLYSGAFRDDHTAGLVALGEALYTSDEVERALRNKLTFVLVEAYQNIVRHASSIPPPLDRGAGRSLFMLGHGDRSNEVVAINPVLRSELPGLRSLLDRLRALDLKQLKELFLQGLQREERSQRGGAGLGLIEMARRSGHELGHVLSDVDEEHALFLLRITVGAASLGHRSEEQIRELHALVAQEDVLLACGGRIDHALQQVLVRFVAQEVELQGGAPGHVQRMVLAAMALADGTAVPGKGTMLALCRQKAEHELVLGMWVEGGTAERIATETAWVDQASAGLLQQRYRDILLGRATVSDPVLFSLLELKRNCSAPLQLAQHPGDGAVFIVLRCLA